MATYQGGHGLIGYRPEDARRLEQQNLNTTTDNTAAAADLQRQQLEGQCEQLEEQRETNALLLINTAIAFQANTLLNDISGTLGEMGYVIEDISATARRSEELQRQQLKSQKFQGQIQRRQLALSNQQLELHKQHFNTLERERAVKDVLFRVEKLFKLTNGILDMMAKAYWAMKQLREIHSRGFSTKDVSDIDDKRLFDHLVTDAQSRIDKLSRDEKSTVQHYINDTEELERIMAISADANVPPPMIDVSDERGEEVSPPSPPPFCNGSWNNQKLVDFERLVSSTRIQYVKSKRAAEVAQYVAAPISIIFALLSMNSRGYSAGFVTLAVSLSLIWIMGKAITAVLTIDLFPDFRTQLKKKFGMDSTIYTGKNAAKRELDRTRQRAGAIREYLDAYNTYRGIKEADELARADVREKVRQHNEKRQKALNAHAKKMDDLKSSLLQRINAFSTQHPDVFRPAGFS